MSKLELLRRNAEETIKENDFFVDTRGCALAGNNGIVPRVQAGHSISFAESVQSGVTRLAIKPDGDDYYFPWVNRGVGHVTVPLNTPNGTVVVTGGMNGCSLQVNKYNGQLIFYHDADSCYLGNLHNPQGEKLCRVEPRLYMLIPRGEQLVNESKGKYSYLYQMLCVKNGGRWKIVYSGILLEGGIDMKIHQAFLPGVSKFLASFDE